MDRTRRHRRGQGSTYRDGDYWVAAYSLGRDKAGKRRMVRKYLRGASERESKRLAEDELKRIRRRYEGVGPVASMPIDEYVSEWLVVIRPGIAPRTFESYSTLYDQHVSPLLGGIRVAELRPADVHRLIRDRLDAGLSPSTIHRLVGVLRMALQQAVRDGELLSNPAKVKLPRIDRERVEAMTPERAEAILELVRYWVDDEGTVHGSPWLDPIVNLLLGTGLRLGEACALDWRDLALAGNTTVTVRRGKTKASQRTIPLRPFVVASLLAHRGRAVRVGPDEPVFLGPKGGERVKRSTVSHAFRRMQERAGMKPIRVHDLRHATATLLVARRVPLRVVADILGHSDPALTARVYAHVSTETMREAMAEMDRAAGD